MKTAHTPPLRPFRVFRFLAHTLGGLLFLWAAETILSPKSTLNITIGMVLFLSSVDLLRKYWPTLNQLFLFIGTPLLHQHEKDSFTSATWFWWSLLFLYPLTQAHTFAICLGILSVSDQMAGIVGRKYGRHQLSHRRTVEGSLAFLTSGLLTAMLIQSLWYPAIPILDALVFAVVGSVSGALGELWSGPMDDNLTIGLGSGLALETLHYLT
ncbi:MAG: phosphatidate cytidylyltransferase [Myxococcota bacterium]|nr:phosphatidate cytidylyltransferase [Myxococcota bacterium]